MASLKNNRPKTSASKITYLDQPQPRRQTRKPAQSEQPKLDPNYDPQAHYQDVSEQLFHKVGGEKLAGKVGDVLAQTRGQATELEEERVAQELKSGQREKSEYVPFEVAMEEYHEEKQKKQISELMDQAYGKGQWDDMDLKITMNNAKSQAPMGLGERMSRRGEGWGVESLDPKFGRFAGALGQIPNLIPGAQRVTNMAGIPNPKLVRQYRDLGNPESGRKNAEALSSLEMRKALRRDLNLREDKYDRELRDGLIDQLRNNPDDEKVRANAADFLHNMSKEAFERMNEYDRDMQTREQPLWQRIVGGTADMAEYMAPFAVGGGAAGALSNAARGSIRAQGALDKLNKGRHVIKALPYMSANVPTTYEELSADEYSESPSGFTNKEREAMGKGEAALRALGDSTREYVIERLLGEAAGKAVGKVGGFAAKRAPKTLGKVAGASKRAKGAIPRKIRDASKAVRELTAFDNFSGEFIEEYADAVSDVILNIRKDQDSSQPMLERVTEATRNFITMAPEIAGSLLLMQGGQYLASAPIAAAGTMAGRKHKRKMKKLLKTLDKQAKTEGKTRDQLLQESGELWESEVPDADRSVLQEHISDQAEETFALQLGERIKQEAADGLLTEKDPETLEQQIRAIARHNPAEAHQLFQVFQRSPLRGKSMIQQRAVEIEQDAERRRQQQQDAGSVAAGGRPTFDQLADQNRRDPDYDPAIFSEDVPQQSEQEALDNATAGVVAQRGQTGRVATGREPRQIETVQEALAVIEQEAPEQAEHFRRGLQQAPERFGERVVRQAQAIENSRARAFIAPEEQPVISQTPVDGPDQVSIPTINMEAWESQQQARRQRAQERQEQEAAAQYEFDTSTPVEQITDEQGEQMQRDFAQAAESGDAAKQEELQRVADAIRQQQEEATQAEQESRNVSSNEQRLAEEEREHYQKLSDTEKAIVDDWDNQKRNIDRIVDEIVDDVENSRFEKKHSLQSAVDYANKLQTRSKRGAAEALSQGPKWIRQEIATRIADNFRAKDANEQGAGEAQQDSSRAGEAQADAQQAPPLPEKSVSMMDEAIANRDTAKLLDEGMLDRRNKAWRQQFTDATGIKLPRTQKKTREVVEEWAAQETGSQTAQEAPDGHWKGDPYKLTGETQEYVGRTWRVATLVDGARKGENILLPLEEDSKSDIEKQKETRQRQQEGFKRVREAEDKTGAWNAKQLSDARQRLKYAQELGIGLAGVEAELNKDDISEIDVDYRETMSVINDAIAKKQRQEKGEESAPEPSTEKEGGKRLVSEEQYKSDVQKMKDLLNRMGAGVDPEIAVVGTRMAIYHAENGVRQFSEFAKRTKEDFAEHWDKIKGYLHGFWSMADTSMEDVELEDLTKKQAAAILEELDKTQKTESIKTDTQEVEDEHVRTSTEGPDGGTQTEGNRRPQEEGQVSGTADRGKGRVRVPGSPRGAKKQQSRGAVSGENESGSPSEGGDGKAASGRSESNGDTGKRRDLAIGKNLAERIGVGGALTKARQNIEAIRILKKLEQEERLPTASEKEKMALYVAWGASDLANNIFRRRDRQSDFDGRKGGGFAPEWAKLGKELEALLTEKELDNVRQSTQYAHYTSTDVIKSIYKGLTRMGFAGGHVLEPGSGNGLFVGLLPAKLRDQVKYSGIERDSLPARIGKMLYPGHDMREGDFVEFNAPDGFYDAAIGNPPFSSNTVRRDSKYRKYHFKLHDYFIAKAMDKVKPGGVVALISSRGTMDKQDARARKYVTDQADLVGAIRLPQTAFKQNAGTEVVTDVMFFRKRLPGEEPGGKAWFKTKTVTTPQGEAEINEYFVDHPSMVLGKHALTGSMYGANEYTVENEDADIEKQFSKAVGKLPKDILTTNATKPQHDKSALLTDLDPGRVLEGAYYLKDGEVHQKLDGVGHPIQPRGKGVKGGKPKADIDRIKKYIPLRDAYKSVQRANITGENLADAQKQLRNAYDAFVKKFGPINKLNISQSGSRTAPNLKPFDDDPVAYSVASLEFYDENARKVTRLSDIFDKPLLLHDMEPDVQNAVDAMNVVLEEKGVLDLDRIAELRGISKQEAVEELGESIYFDPIAKEWQDRDTYLSGDVKTKLQQAEEATTIDESYQRNVKALKQVIPEDLPPSNITLDLGTAIVPADVVQDFARNVLGLESSDVHFDPAGGKWHLRTDLQDRKSAAATQEWGTSKRNSAELLDAALNNKSVKVTKEVNEPGGGTKKVTDEDGTRLAKQKLTAIRDRFRAWVFENGERANRLTSLFNEKLNRTVSRSYSAEFLSFPGMSAAFTPYQHQRSIVWRIIQEGNAYMAHEVGAGKTLASIAAGMEMRRLGMVKKPMYVVPNQVLKQFAAEFQQAYPLAKVLVADDNNFTRSRRRGFIGLAANNDWDAVVITHSAFGKIAVHPETKNKHIKNQLDAAQEAYADAEGDGVARHVIKQLEKRIESLKDSFESMDIPQQDQGTHFEEMGVDYLFVDEAHEFRKLSFETAQSNIKGVDPNGSKRTWDLYMKSRTLQSRNPRRFMTLMSGTPITNTIGELYTVQRFLQEPQLEELGLHKFDSWVSTFGQVVQELESSPLGYTPVARLRDWKNLKVLAQMWQQMGDVVFTGDLDYLKLPELRGGAPAEIVGTQTEAQKAYAERLKERAKQIKKRKKPPKKGDDIIPVVITDGKHSAMDQRFIDPSLPADPSSKLEKLIDKVFEIYRNTSSFKGTQAVFSDLGVPGAETRRGFSAYNAIRDGLIKRGVSPNEIAFVQQANTLDKKRLLFDKVKEGKIRVIIGGRGMETGANMQTRLVALHHLDAPWYPASLQQRNGRIIRQGNTNDEVGIYYYVTKGSYDEQVWGILTSKVKWLSTFLRGATDNRAEDIGVMESQYQQLQALTSNDPRILDLAKKRSRVSELESLRRAHIDAKQRATSEIDHISSDIAFYNKQLPMVQKAVAQVETVKGDQFSMTLAGTTFSERKKAGEALLEITKTAEGMKHDVFKSIGSFAGADMKIGHSLGGLRLRLQFPSGYKSHLYLSWSMVEDKSPAGLVRSLTRLTTDIPRRAAKIEESLQQKQEQKKEFQNQRDKQFEHTEELERLEREVDELEKTLIEEAANRDKVPEEGTDEEQPSPEPETEPESITSQERSGAQESQQQNNNKPKASIVPAGPVAFTPVESVEEPSVDATNFLGDHAASKDENLRILTGVNVEGDLAVATNGKLIVAVPKESLHDLADAEDGTYDPVSKEPINGDFPNWRNVLPNPQRLDAQSGSVSVQDLLKQLYGAKKVRDKYSDIEPGTLAASLTLDGKNRALFDVDLLIGALHPLYESGVRSVRLSADSSNVTRGPMQIDAENSDALAVIMPQWQEKITNPPHFPVTAAGLPPLQGATNADSGTTSQYRDVAEQLAPRDRRRLREIGRKIFGDEWVVFRDKVMTPEGREVAGRYQNSWAEISEGKGDPKNTILHEAVHRAEAMFLTDSELAALRRIEPDAEKRAEGIIQYINDGRGLKRRIKRIIDRMLRRLRAFLGSPRGPDGLFDFYDRLLAGEYAKRNQNGGRQQMLPGLAPQFSPDSAAVDSNAEQWYNSIDETMQEETNAEADNVSETAGPGVPIAARGRWRRRGVPTPTKWKGERPVFKYEPPPARQPTPQLNEDTARERKAREVRQTALADRTNTIRLESLYDIARRPFYSYAANGWTYPNVTRAEIEYLIEHTTPKVIERYGEDSDIAMLANLDPWRWAATSAGSIERYRSAEQVAATDERLAGEVDSWLKGQWRDWTEPILKRDKDRDEKAEISKIRRLVTTVQHYAERVPALKRLFDVARNFDRRKHEILTDIFGPLDNSGDMAAIHKFVTKGVPLHRKLTGAMSTEGQALMDYIVAQDRDAEGPGVAKDEDTGRFSVLTPKGNVVQSDIASEQAAWTAAHRWEAAQLQKRKFATTDERGREVSQSFSPEAADALVRYRGVTDRAYDELMRSAREYEEKMEELGLDIPEDQADLFAALRQMGDRRGYYMPRRHGSGSYRMYAERGEEKYFRKFDTRRARSAQKRKLAADGWSDFNFERTTEHPSEYAMTEVSLTSLNDLLQNALAKMNNLDESSLTWDQFGLTMETIPYERQDGTTEQHHAIRGDSKKYAETLKALGGRWMKDRQYWFWTNPSDALQAEILKSVAQTELGTVQPMEKMGETLVKQIATLIQSHGSRSAKIGRKEAIGADVMQGYDTTPLSDLVAYGSSVAGGSSKREMAQRMMKIITGTETSWRDFSEGKLPEDFDAENPAHRKLKQGLWREYKKQVDEARLASAKQPEAYNAGVEFMQEMIRNEEASERIMGTIKGLAAIKFLTGLAPAGVNLTALVTNAPAVMKGYANIPIRRSAGLLRKGLDRYGRYYMFHKFGEGSDLRNDQAYGDKWLFDEITRRGYDEAPMVREALGGIQNQFGHTWRKMTDWMTGPFAITERFNRAATIAGTYWGIRAQHKGEWTEKDAQAALDKARYVSDQTHGVYGKVNQHDFGRGTHIGAQVWRAFYTYKTFSHNYLTVLGKLGYKDATAILNARSQKEFNEAIKNNSSLYMLLSPMVLSGVGAGAGGLGLMLANSMMKAVASLIPGWEPPDDLEEWIWEESVRMFGDTGGRLARQGVVGLTGVNIKGSLAIRGDDFVPTSIPDLLGAPYALFEDIGLGARDLARGNVARAIETAVAPRILRGPMKATREAVEGVASRSGTPAYWGGERIQPSWYDTLLRGLGLNPSAISEKRERQWKEYKIKSTYDDLRSEIYRQIRLFQLQPTQSPAEWAQILQAVEDYNARLKRQGHDWIPSISDSTIKSVVTRASRPNRRERKR